MRLLPFLLTACCVSLLSLQLAVSVRAEERTDTRRLDLINQLFDISDDAPPSSPLPPPSDSAPLSGLPTSLLRRRLPPSLSWASPSSGSSAAPQPSPLLRPRRQLRGTHHHGQLMRVGCKLGTCQVQNLSHRLYQLIGQRGREDSSPINPRSPHSFG